MLDAALQACVKIVEAHLVSGGMVAYLYPDLVARLSRHLTEAGFPLGQDTRPPRLYVLHLKLMRRSASSEASLLLTWYHDDRLQS